MTSRWKSSIKESDFPSVITNNSLPFLAITFIIWTWKFSSLSSEGICDSASNSWRWTLNMICSNKCPGKSSFVTLGASFKPNFWRMSWRSLSLVKLAKSCWLFTHDGQLDGFSWTWKNLEITPHFLSIIFTYHFCRAFQLLPFSHHRFVPFSPMFMGQMIGPHTWQRKDPNECQWLHYLTLEIELWSDWRWQGLFNALLGAQISLYFSALL